MQAAAKNVSGKTDVQKMNDNASIETLENNIPLFSNDDIMFPDESVDRPYTRYGYKISGMNFLIPENITTEIIQSPNIFSLPNSPVWIEGLINIRGNIIPVMNVSKLLNKEKKESMTNVLLLDKTDTSPAIAILINDLPVSLEHNESNAATDGYPDELMEYIQDGFVQNGNGWVEIDLKMLFKNLSGK